VTLADDQGIVEVTRAELAKALRVSIPTIARGLRELRRAGELEMMEKGGGRGRPSRYRIINGELEMMEKGGGRGRPSRYRIIKLRRERDHVRLTGAAVVHREYLKPRSEMRTSTPKPGQGDPDHEPDLDSEAIRALAADLGEAIVNGAAACLQGAVKAWRGLSTWQRATLAGLPLGALGMFMGRRYGGKLGAAIGGGSGLLAGAALALLVPPEERAADAPADRPTSPEARELATDHSLIGYLARQASQN